MSNNVYDIRGVHREWRFCVYVDHVGNVNDMIPDQKQN